MFRAHVKRQLRSIVTIVAMVVVALAALAPAITNALGHTPVANWVELCSAQGTKRVAVNAAGEPISPAEQALQHTERCPFCHIEHIPAMLPPACGAVILQPITPHEFPSLFYAASRPLHAWAPAQARAPPYLS